MDKLTTEEPPQQQAPPPANNVARSAGIVSLAVFSSRITGLVREMIMASLFGASYASDAFQVAFRLPNLTRDLFAEGALSSAFIPTFTEYLTKRSKEEAAKLANLVATSLIIVVGAVCALGVIFSYQLVAISASGYQQVPGKFELAVTMTQIMFPFLLLVALAAQAMGVLNACNRFAVPATASTLFNIGSVSAGLILGYWLGPYIGIQRPIIGMAWGVVVGGLAQLLWQVPSLHAAGFRFRPMLDWNHPGLQHIFRLMGPAILGNAAVQINVLVNTYFASHINDPVKGFNGPTSWLNFAFRLMQLPLGIFGVAIASATLPAISRSVAHGDIDEFRRTLSRSLGLVLLLTVPSSVGLMVLGQSIIGAIYQRGRFDTYDTQQTGAALSFYALGLAGYSALKVLTPAFYALKETRVPMIVSLLSVAINATVVTLVVRGADWGHKGLALSTSLVALFGFVILFWKLRNRIGGIHGRDLMRSTIKILFASALMGLIVTGSSLLVLHRLGTSQFAHLADLLVSLPLGLITFYFAARFAGIPELDLAVTSLAGPLGRRIPWLRGKIR